MATEGLTPSPDEVTHQRSSEILNEFEGINLCLATKLRCLREKHLEEDKLEVIVRTNKIHLFLPWGHRRRRKAPKEPITEDKIKIERMMIEAANRDNR